MAYAVICWNEPVCWETIPDFFLLNSLILVLQSLSSKRRRPAGFSLRDASNHLFLGYAPGRASHKIPLNKGTQA